VSGWLADRKQPSYAFPTCPTLNDPEARSDISAKTGGRELTQAPGKGGHKGGASVAPSSGFAASIFKCCVRAIRKGVLIQRVSRTDKEFHFQNWFKSRLQETSLNFEVGGRNTYPDFRLVAAAEGYELKGLAYPGRTASFDSNSQLPSGFHNGRTIYYVFGRYPKRPDGNSYPVLDLVICHGDFLNADHDYLHKNQSVRCFGSYGDILIRDRKMYVVPTPFRLVEGLAHQQTLIVPGDTMVEKDLAPVGYLLRREADELIAAYSFDLKTNQLDSRKVPNPAAGREHIFRAWRLKESPLTSVSMCDLEGEEDRPQARKR